MTSVLYSAGLNYQNGNPLRTEINKLNNEITELRKLVDAQRIEMNLLKATVNVISVEREREKAAAKAAAEAAAKKAAETAAGAGGTVVSSSS